LSVSGALSAAVSGLHASQLQFRIAANNVVNANTETYEAKEVRTFSQIAGENQAGVSAAIVEGGNVDLATEFVTMIQAKTSYSANAEVITTMDELIGSLLDITS